MNQEQTEVVLREIGKQICEIKDTLQRDKEDQWKSISDLNKEIKKLKNEIKQR